jgi:hypothetical protein
MQTINLKRIIEKQDLKPKWVAEQLFPENKYPKLALDRVLDGKAFLDTNQVSRLSAITGIPINFLYSGGEWEMKSTENKISFTSDDYLAELNTQTWKTEIYHKGSIFHETLIHSEGIPLGEYLSQLTNLINKHSKP